MIVNRLAVATVFVCISILLLSACGFGGRNSPPVSVQPVLLGGKFAVYAQDHTLLAVGGVEPTSDLRHIYGYLTFKAPECLRDQVAQLRGSINPELELVPHSPNQLKVVLRSSTPALYTPYAIRVFPFAGTLSLAKTCAGKDEPVQVELIP